MLKPQKGVETRGRLFPNATKRRIPYLRSAAPRTRRPDRADSHGSRAAHRARSVVRAALRRHGPQVAHAEHHRQVADAAVVRSVRSGACHRSAENRGSGEAVGVAASFGIAGRNRS